MDDRWRLPYVPDDFDDSDADSQVHPVARRFFFGRTWADPFGAAQQWLGQHHVRLLDTSFDIAFGEDEPIMVSVFFSFEPDDHDDPFCTRCRSTGTGSVPPS